MAKKKIPSYAKEFKNHKVIVFDDNQSITHYKVYGIDEDTLETEEDILPLKDAFKVYDNNHGGFTFIYNLPEIAKVQASELKELRRSKVIKNIMNFETEKSFDLGKMFPYLIALVALLF